MSYLLGVDSAAPFTEARWAAVLSVLGRKPDAVGRPADGPDALTEAEIPLLRQWGVRVWLWGSRTNPKRVGGTLPEGVTYGDEMASSAARLGYRAGCILGADFEAVSGWSPTPGWIGGTAYGLMAWGMEPMAYGAPGNWAFDEAFTGARRAYLSVGRRLQLWAAVWSRPAYPKVPPRTMLDTAHVGVHPAGWQWAGNVPLPGFPPDEGIDLDLWSEEAGLWTP